MNSKAVELEDILEVVNDLTTMVSEGFDRVDAFRVENNGRLTSLEKGQTETNQRLDKIEGTLEAIQADIKELYKMVSGLRKDMDGNKVSVSELEKRLSEVEAFARMLSKQTGIGFK